MFYNVFGLTSLIVRSDCPDWPPPDDPDAPENEYPRWSLSLMLPAPPTEKDLEKGLKVVPADADVFIMAAVEAVEVSAAGGGGVTRLLLFPFPLGVDVVINRQLALADEAELRSGRDTIGEDKNADCHTESWLKNSYRTGLGNQTTQVG